MAALGVRSPVLSHCVTHLKGFVLTWILLSDCIVDHLTVREGPLWSGYTNFDFGYFSAAMARYFS
jgi:hypothetical protein